MLIESLLRVSDIVVDIQGSRVLRGVSLDVGAGELVCLVGRNGAGKTTTFRTIMGFCRPVHGAVRFDGSDVTGRRPHEIAKRGIGYAPEESEVFGDLTVAENIAMPTWTCPGGRDTQVRIDDAYRVFPGLARYRDRGGHMLSGGERKMVSIARALALDPALIIYDEAVSSLDVLIRAQVLNLLERLRSELSLTYLFIAHDLALVKQVSDRVAVMYLGKLVEIGPAESLYREPLHPYTVALLASIPNPDPTAPRAPAGQTIHGEPPSPIDPPSGCRFRTRCPRAQDVCAAEEPPLRKLADGHFAACHFPVSRDPLQAAGREPARLSGGQHGPATTD